MHNLPGAIIVAGIIVGVVMVVSLAVVAMVQGAIYAHRQDAGDNPPPIKELGIFGWSPLRVFGWLSLATLVLAVLLMVFDCVPG